MYCMSNPTYYRFSFYTFLPKKPAIARCAAIAGCKVAVFCAKYAAGKHVNSIGGG